MLDLPKFFVLTLQLLLVDLVALHLGHGTFVVKVGHCTVDLRAEIMVIFEELELTRGVSAEWSG